MPYERVIAIADVHGSFDLLRRLVEDVIRFDPGRDQLVVIGDMIDRARDSKQVVLYLQDLRRQYPENVVLLLGNHEDMARRYFLNEGSGAPDDMEHLSGWMAFGGKATIRSFGEEQAARNILVPFIETLRPYYETGDHIFVHGGIPRGTRDIAKVPLSTLLWSRDWTYDGAKTLVVGHTPHSSIIRRGKTVCIDTGASYMGKLTGYDVKNGRVYETEALSRKEHFVSRLSAVPAVSLKRF